MRVKEDSWVRSLLQEEMNSEHHQERDATRERAWLHILRIRQENVKTFNKHRIPEQEYRVNDLVAIRTSQYGCGPKLRSNL